MSKRNKILLIISIILVSIILVIGGTLAFFGWRADKESTVAVTVASGTGSCSLGYDNDKFLEPTTGKENGRIIKLKASHEVGEEAYIEWNMKIKSINGLQNKTFKYEMVNSTTGKSYGTGTFENVTSGSTITFSNEVDILNFGDEYEFTLYLWIDGTIGNNPLSMADQDFDFNIKCNIIGTKSGVKVKIDNIGYKSWDEAKPYITETSDVVIFDDYTVDLAGSNLTAKNIRVYGNLIDSTDGESSIVASEKLWFNGHNNGNYFPIQDAENECYHLYEASVKIRGAKKDSDDVVKFGYTAYFNKTQAYKLLGEKIEDNLFTILFTIPEQGDEITYTFTNSISKAFVDKAYEELAAGKVKASMNNYLHGFSTANNGDVIKATPIITSNIGVKVIGASYEYEHTK